jgi:hypothetical protein
MKRYKPIINNFKETFFNGGEMDPSCMSGKGAGAGRGRGRGRGSNVSS